MKRTRCAALIVLAAGVGMPTLALAQADDEATVRAVVEALATYSQAGDWAGLDSLYAPGRGVHIIEGAGVNHGWADYRDDHLKPELAELENMQYRYYNVEPQIRGDVAWASFRYDFSADTPRGQVEIEGRGTTILERLDGRWRVVHHHTSGRPVRRQ